MNKKEKLEELGISASVDDKNVRHPRNGSSALTSACQMSRQDVLKLLEKEASSRTSVTGETPKSMSTNSQILQMAMSDGKMSNQNLTQSPVEDCAPVSSKETNAESVHLSNELVLKVRLANTQDTDFIEIDLPRTCLTFQALLHVCCQELNIEESQVLRLRKLPNTKIRRDKDVERLENFQEIEVVTELTFNDVNSQISNGAAMPLVPSNNYQSISKKDQTILY